MEFFKFDTTKKYTKSLLDTFNDIQVEKYIDDEHTKLVTVPISFGSKDAASAFSEIETEQLLQGNFNILPRMSLSLTDMERDDQRATSRFQIPIRIEGLDGKMEQYQHNCVPYIFRYNIQIVTRSLTDLTTILEQILPFFNPNLNIKVRELDWLTEPTTLNVELMSVTYDLPGEYDGADIRICTADVMIAVHGNIYPPLKNSALIKSVKYYLNSVVDFDEEHKDILHKFNVDENTFLMIPETFTRIDYTDTWNKVRPEIKDIIGSREILVDTNNSYRIMYEDDTDDNIKFIINVVEDSGVKPIISKQLNYFTVQAREQGFIKLSVQAINSLDLQSDTFMIEIEVTDGTNKDKRKSSSTRKKS